MPKHRLHETCRHNCTHKVHRIKEASPSHPTQTFLLCVKSILNSQIDSDDDDDDEDDVERAGSSVRTAATTAIPVSDNGHGQISASSRASQLDNLSASLYYIAARTLYKQHAVCICND